MFSARALMRSAPRAVSRIAMRPAMAARPSTLLRAPCTPARPHISAFSTSLLRKAPAGAADIQISDKIKAEMDFETRTKEAEVLPVSIKDFLDNSPFDLKDIPGMQDVTLSRQYGNENITVTFSIADINSLDHPAFDEDDAMSDEEGEDGEGRSAREEEGEDGEETETSDQENGITCRLNIVVEKEGNGALNIDASCQDGAIIVENMYYYKDAAIAHSATPDAVHKERDVYPGPQFGTLDEDLQVLMEQYLDERGINSALAVFVPDYMDMKEHNEYLLWLQNVKAFIDA